MRVSIWLNTKPHTSELHHDAAGTYLDGFAKVFVGLRFRTLKGAQPDSVKGFALGFCQKHKLVLAKPPNAEEHLTYSNRKP